MTVVVGAHSGNGTAGASRRSAVGQSGIILHGKIERPLFQLMRAPGARRDANDFSEGCGKMALVGKTAGERDLGQGGPGLNQMTLSRFDALHDQILVRWQTRRLLEGASKMLGRESSQLGQIIQTDLVRNTVGNEVASPSQMPR